MRHTSDGGIRSWRFFPPGWDKNFDVGVSSIPEPVHSQTNSPAREGFLISMAAMEDKEIWGETKRDFLWKHSGSQSKTEREMGKENLKHAPFLPQTTAAGSFWREHRGTQAPLGGRGRISREARKSKHRRKKNKKNRENRRDKPSAELHSLWEMMAPALPGFPSPSKGPVLRKSHRKQPCCRKRRAMWDLAASFRPLKKSSS